MISLRQFWHAYWISSRWPEDVFGRMIARPGWRKLVLHKNGNRIIYFVYPEDPGFASKRMDRFL